jgi:hypothetical protein
VVRRWLLLLSPGLLARLVVLALLQLVLLLRQEAVNQGTGQVDAARLFRVVEAFLLEDQRQGVC